MMRSALLAATIALTLSACSSPTDEASSSPVSGQALALATGAVLPAATQGTAYSTTLVATGGSGTFGWSVASGTVPAGLSLGASTGTISGTPTAAGTSTFTVQVTSGAQSATRSFTLAVLSSALVLQWPLSGSDGVEWVINNYVDLDPTTGVRDYTAATGAGAKTYDGHNGVDIDIGSFRRMDSGEAIVTAAAAGTVVSVVDGNFDRNLACLTDNPNLVDIRHANGTLARYLHLKRNSIVVAVGQPIEAGAVLGVVGSSGCSTAPHLHFELRDAQNRVLDPFLSGMWAAPPAYSRPLSVMDGIIRSDSFTQQDAIAQLYDPAPNAASVPVNTSIGVGMHAAGGAVGSRLRVTTTNASGQPIFSGSLTFTAVYRHSAWYFNTTVNSPGIWTIRLFADAVEVRSYTLNVLP